MTRPSTVTLPKLQGELPDKMVQRTVPANSVFAMGERAAAAAPPAAAPAGRATRQRLVPPDLSSLVIQTDRKPPQRIINNGIGDTWAALWARMPVGGSVDLTTLQAKSFSSWAKKQKHLFTVRKLDTDTTAVWRKA
jgi:hypothetical protein